MMDRKRPDYNALAAATLVGAAALYLLFVGQAGWNESLCAAVVAVLAAAYACAVVRVAPRSLRLRPALPGEFLRGVASIPLDTVRVGRALLAAVQTRPDGAVGVIERQAFRRGEDGEAAGWRAVAGLGASVAPNGYVVDLAEDGDALIHRLVPTGSSR